ncbi:Competence protein F-like protein, phosphoribosyltransferase domain protein [Rubellimicrobium mesophilum DSM 19309]|uniref:Competence protein F-like protein, phosphoribosyltransferase domain protein n=1 Tax=Rubellimicrobium mesophilum DSM 19309 TaxID=442562 RepID=A0A017HMG4_9RHOB|nr:double zinc ribbon domain-containing protein [Rubellimicrobium mesophilum]EYD75363.1 Competence protein F-like protein, phosphoribosyltransferase domain protein [Rubellimicrobium mesophilum DSM 19309]
MQSAAELARGVLGTVRRALYPPACVACGTLTDSEFALCGTCWREAGFLAGALVCDACGTPLPGQDDGPVHCDDCLRRPRPWTRGRAALPYRGTGRALVLALKHSDRTDLAKPLGAWLAAAARPLVLPGQALVPVPLHWTRLARRRHNQAQLLAREAGRHLGLPVLPDALVRTRSTKSLGHGGREARAKSLEGAIAPHPRRGAALAGRPVLLVDDVMTSGATLAAAAQASLAAGATGVRVIVLARALLEP